MKSFGEHKRKLPPTMTGSKHRRLMLTKQIEMEQISENDENDFVSENLSGDEAIPLNFKS